jgi:general secretion pathway protein A
MYYDFFGFSEAPFSLSPDPDFLFMAMSHWDAMSSIVSGVKERKRLITLTGDVGTGKTTLIYALMKDLNEKIKTAFISNPRLSFKDLMKTILWDLKVPVQGKSIYTFLQKFDSYLQERLAGDETVVFLIDEAQNLSVRVLEDLDRFLQRETPALKLLQILLVGQPDLDANLDLEELRLFKQRITVQRRLTPLNREECPAYIDHRLRVVGSNRSKVFTPEAVSLICEFAKGIPREINNLCDQALWTGYIFSTPKIDANIVKRVIKEEEDADEGKYFDGREVTAEGKPKRGMEYFRFQDSARFLGQDFSELRGQSMKKNIKMSIDAGGEEIRPLATSEPKDISYRLCSNSFLGLYKSLKEKCMDLEIKKNLSEKECAELTGKIANKELELKETQESLKLEAGKRRSAEKLLEIMQEQLLNLSLHFLDLQEKDRKFISDELLHVITSLVLSLKSGAEDIFLMMKGESKEALFNFEQTLYNLQNGIQKAEEILVRLYPPALDDLGMLAGIDWYCQKFQKYHTQFQVSQNIDVEEEQTSDFLKTQLFRTMQDGLDIFSECSKEGRICVFIAQKDGRLQMILKKDNQIFDLENPFSGPKGIGLARMRLRTELSGGSFSIEPGDTSETLIRASWPI